MSRAKSYTKVPNTKSIWKHKKSKKFLAEKKIDGKTISATFNTLFEAKRWRKNSEVTKSDTLTKSDYATLKEVWEEMQRSHFPTLQTSTKRIWLRRYKLLESIENYPMDQISSPVLNTWIAKWVHEFTTNDEYSSRRGNAGRCNLNNELNLLVTIFNWYKCSDLFSKEAQTLNCPVNKNHKRLGFIKPAPDKKRQMNLEDALKFFDCLPQLYRDLAMMQFFIAGRIGETAGLQWTNIDLLNRRMLVKHTCIWDDHKVFLELKPFPKNREARPVFLTDEILEILERRKCFRIDGCDFVFHVEGKPINYGTVLVNYRAAQRKSGVPYSGTHVLRHGMATLARKVGGGLDAVMAMTGHKCVKLANHYSKCDEDDQKEVSQKIMEHYRKFRPTNMQKHENVIEFRQYSKTMAE